jgi:hypothetical protein
MFRAVEIWQHPMWPDRCYKYVSPRTRSTEFTRLALVGSDRSDDARQKAKAKSLEQAATQNFDRPMLVGVVSKGAVGWARHFHSTTQSMRP